jgi:hypothetical protein
LRFNFVAAAHRLVRLTPQFLRALHLELFTRSSRIIKVSGSGFSVREQATSSDDRSAIKVIFLLLIAEIQWVSAFFFS